HFGYVVPPEFVDVIMIAPHAPGIAVREKFLEHESISAFTSVSQDFTGKAKSKLIRLSKAFGITKSKLVETTFKDEAIGDLFGEQTVLCGGMSELILAGYNTLVKNGIPEENAYLEVAYQLDLIIELIKKYGIEGMYERISVAARFGSLQNGKKIIDSSVSKKMEKVYEEIASGKFPDKLNKLTKDDIDQLGKKVKKSSVSSYEFFARKYSKK
ncbi:MAG: ketol-acid reductoisomerase, partial [Calditrichaeota bacterium]